MRSVHLSDAKCKACVYKHRRQYENQQNANMREIAKRYRILMATLGWEDFGDLMEYLRTVPWTEKTNERHRDLLVAA